MEKSPERLRKFDWYLPHQAWLRLETRGSRHSGERRLPCCADLRGVDLHSADLHTADLRRANLSGVDLRNADLHGADLRSANLSGADLRGADLCRADLRNADLSRADLRGSILRFGIFINSQTLFAGCQLAEARIGENLLEWFAENYPAEYLGYVLTQQE